MPPLCPPARRSRSGFADRIAAGLMACALLTLPPGCAGAQATSSAPAGFTADTATPTGLVQGATATEIGCRALGETLWVAAGPRQECLRYIGAGLVAQSSYATALVILPGDPAGAAYRSVNGRPVVEGAGQGEDTPAPRMRRAAAAALSAAAGDRPVILLARPGMQGSSGHHASDRHSRDEVALIDAALTMLRQRYGFRDFALHGFSSGGTLVANLLARRGDIRCAIIASAPLDLATFYRAPDGSALDEWLMRRSELADPMQLDALPSASTEIVVLGDPGDRRVAASGWRRWAAAMQRKGLRITIEEVESLARSAPGGGVPDRHGPSPRGLEHLLACTAPEISPGREGAAPRRLDAAATVLRALE